MLRARTRKRPCTICRRWFMPDYRQIGRQKTCDNPECRKELHRRQCQKWYRKNQVYFKAIYLNKKLACTSDPPASSFNKPAVVIPLSRIDLKLPKDVIIEITGKRQLIILDYIIEQIVQRAAASPPLRAP